MEAVNPRDRVLELPYPPSVNHIWRRMGSRTVLSREGRRYRQRVCAALAAATGGRPPRLRGRLELRMRVFPPDKRRRDLDNLQKCVWDALARAGVYADDSQIDRFSVERGPVIPAGKVQVEIHEIACEQAVGAAV